MEKKLSKALDEVICSITESKEFKECIELKNKMDENKKIKELVENVKKLQKKYIRTLDDNVKEELDKIQEELNNIPIYVSYQNKVSEVNAKIEIVKEELNNYFYKVVNPK